MSRVSVVRIVHDRSYAIVMHVKVTAICGARSAYFIIDLVIKIQWIICDKLQFMFYIKSYLHAQSLIKVLRK